MLSSITNGWQKGSLAWKFRQARLRKFLETIKDLPRPVRILDVGGTEPYWLSFEEYLEGLDITILNLHRQEVSDPRIRSIQGDACDLVGIKDQEYDVIFSNSVIEHLHTLENQQRMAHEVMRVGRRYYVQTPNRHFPIEPHFLFPFFTYLPKPWKIGIASKWRYGSYCSPGDPVAAKASVEEIRLLTEEEMRSLFPKARLEIERAGPLKKSFVAIG